MIEDLFFENEDKEKDLVSEDQPVIKHLCFSDKGSAEGCEGCNVKRREFCDEMLQVLTSQRLLYGLDKDAINDIIGKVIDGIQKNIDSYRGRDGAQFASYVRRIVRYKRADYFREFYQKTPNFKGKDINDLSQLIKQIKQRNTKAIEYVYKEWLSDETKTLIDEEETDTSQIQDNLLKDLNRILDNKDKGNNDREFYNSEKFENIDISTELLKLAIKNEKTIEETRKVNRALLEIIFPSLGSTSAGKIIELPIEEYEDKLKVSPDIEKKLYVSQVLSALKNINIECYNLYLKLYEGFNDGRTQKEIAEELGLKPNTFNKKLERCREKVLEELKKGKLI